MSGAVGFTAVGVPYRLRLGARTLDFVGPPASQSCTLDPGGMRMYHAPLNKGLHAAIRADTCPNDPTTFIVHA